MRFHCFFFAFFYAIFQLPHKHERQNDQTASDKLYYTRRSNQFPLIFFAFPRYTVTNDTYTVVCIFRQSKNFKYE